MLCYIREGFFQTLTERIRNQDLSTTLRANYPAVCAAFTLLDPLMNSKSYVSADVQRCP